MDTYRQKLERQVLASNPAIAKQQLAWEQEQQQNRARNQFMTDFAGQQATPAQAGVYANQGTPNTKYGAMDMNVGGLMQEQPTPIQAPVEAQEGTGVLGGKTSPMQQTMSLMGAPTQDLRNIGGSLYQQQVLEQMKPQAAQKYESPYAYAPRFDPLSGKAYGMRKDTGRYEEVPGMAGIPEPQAPAETEKPMSIKDIAGIESTIRKDFTSDVKDFRKTERAWNIINTANKTGIGDTAMVYTVMKLLDPGSTVNAGEQAMASNAAGVPAKIRNYYNTLLNGDELSPKARKEIIDQAENIYSKEYENYTRSFDQYTDIAKSRNADPFNVVGKKRVVRKRINQPDSESAKSLPAAAQNVIRQMIAGGATKAEVKEYIAEQRR